MDDFRQYREGSMTQQSLDAWSNLAPEWQIRRLTDWALMLEARMSELDPNYRAYQFGLVTETEPTRPKMLALK